MRKIDFKVGDLVKHRFINYGCGIIIEERESVEFGEILKAFVVYFSAEDLKRLVYVTEIDEFIPNRGHSCR
tara:strand:- start:138 stop:350 length:213 start_codon:yes stop_codon:yes gene_type:complete